MSWADVEEEQAKAKAGGLFLKLVDDGDTAVVVFRGEPAVRRTHWTGEKTLDCEGDSCSWCADDLRQRVSIQVNVARQIEEGWIAQIWEASKSAFSGVTEIREKFALEKWSFEITRHGAKGDPKTRYSILPDHEVTTEEKGTFSDMELHLLGPEARGVKASDGRLPDDLVDGLIALATKAGVPGMALSELCVEKFDEKALGKLTADQAADLTDHLTRVASQQ